MRKASRVVKHLDEERTLIKIFSFWKIEERNNLNIVLILEDPKDFSNVTFLGPMEFIGIGRFSNRAFFIRAIHHSYY